MGKVITREECNALKAGSFSTLPEMCPTRSEVEGVGLQVSKTYATNQLCEADYVSSIDYTFTIANWSLSLPWTASTTSAITITSYKVVNGTQTNVGWDLDTTTLPSWLTFNSSSMTFTATANSGAQRDARVYFTQKESGKTDYVDIVQAKKTDYSFVASPNPITLSATSATGSVTVTSTLNGSAHGWDLTTSGIPTWLTVTQTSSGLSLSATNNTSESTRTTTITITQKDSGNTIQITVNQAGAKTEWKYTFTVTPPYDQVIPNTADTLAFTITSYKQYYVNGNQSGSQVAVGWSGARLTGESTFVGSKVNDTRYEVTIPANTTYNSRSATFRWVQEETSDQQSKQITQVAADNDYDFRISLVSGGPYYSSVEVDYPAGGGVDAPTYTFHLYSRKNGALFSNSVAKVESNANWITITAQDRPAFTVAINSDSASRDGIITLTQKESGNTCQIRVHQAGADVEEWRYTFDVTPTALTFGSTGGSQSLKVTCYKTKWINNVEQPSTKIPVDWYSEPENFWLTGVDAPNSQGGGVGSCGISADANSGIYRSGEVTIVNSETQFAVNIIVNQAAYVPSVFVFTWKDGSTSSKIKNVEWNQIAVRDISGEYEVISTKDGSSHPYSLVSKPSWVTLASISGVRLTIDVGEENTSTTDRTGNLIFEQDDSGNRLVIVFTQKGQKAQLPKNTIQITSVSIKDNKYTIYFKSTYPVTSDVKITWSLRKDELSGHTNNYVVMKSGMDTRGVKFTPVPWQKYAYVTIETLTPESDANYQYVYPNQRFPIEWPASDRFEISIDNLTGAPVDVSLQGGDDGSDRESVPIGGTLGSGYADLYVNGIVNLKHDYASGDYLYVRVSHEDGSTDWNSVTWSEQGATSSLNGKLYHLYHGDLGAGKVRMVVNTNIDGSIDEGTFGVLNFELRDGKTASIIFEHRPNL